MHVTLSSIKSCSHPAGTKVTLYLITKDTVSVENNNKKVMVLNKILIQVNCK